MNKKNFSIVIPVLNEADNILKLINEIHNVFNDQNEFQILIIDDCSIDDTFKKLSNLNYHNIKVIKNEINMGQSYSIYRGVENAKYNTIITMDGDGQNNPKDLPLLLNHYYKDNNKKIICGIRKNRQDNMFKIFCSKLANNIRNIILNDGCSDTGCALKVFDKKYLLSIDYFDGLHRFLPALFKGIDILPVYVDVSHRPRIYGNSKYGLMNRMFKGIYDIHYVYRVNKKKRNK